MHCSSCGWIGNNLVHGGRGMASSVILMQKELIAIDNISDVKLNGYARPLVRWLAFEK